MRLKLENLQKVVKQVIDEEKNSSFLCEEVSKALGTGVLVEHGINRMAESANEALDVMIVTGKSPGRVKTSLLMKFINSDSHEIRKLVARLLPESFLLQMANDKHPQVRAAVARRLPRKIVKEMIEKNPSDDYLKVLERDQRILEAGLPTPVVSDTEFDLYGEFPLGPIEDSVEHPGLTDQHYKTIAHKVVKDYGGNLEGQWEEIAVKRYCDSNETYGVLVDPFKLLKYVYEILDARDEAVMKEHSSLSNIAKKLRENSQMEEAFMPVISDSKDEVIALLESNLTPNQYITKFESLFCVEKRAVENPGIKKGIYESIKRVNCPASATIPGNYARSIDERAVDCYVKHWNSQRSLKKQPYVLSWDYHSSAGNKVGFYLGVK